MIILTQYVKKTKTRKGRDKAAYTYEYTKKEVIYKETKKTNISQKSYDLQYLPIIKRK